MAHWQCICPVNGMQCTDCPIDFTGRSKYDCRILQRERHQRNEQRLAEEDQFKKRVRIKSENAAEQNVSLDSDGEVGTCKTCHARVKYEDVWNHKKYHVAAAESGDGK